MNKQAKAKLMRKGHYRRRYNSTVSDYDFHMSIQNYGCAICGKPEKKDRRLDMDHDHYTGELRGLLCNKCNMMVGRFERMPDMGLEKQENLRKKIEDYLTGRVLLDIL